MEKSNIVQMNDLFFQSDKLLKSTASYVYFLVDKGDVVYVGQTKQPRSRVNAHKKNPDKIFDDVRYIEIHENELDRIENLFIQAIKPKYNSTIKENYEFTYNDWTFFAGCGCEVLLPLDMQSPTNKKPKSLSFGAVRVIDGPFEGQTGYYDDDEIVYPSEDNDIFDVDDECFDEDLFDTINHLHEIGHKMNPVGEYFAVVYLGELTEGTTLIPYQWLEKIDSKVDIWDCCKVADKFWPGLMDSTKQFMKSERL